MYLSWLILTILFADSLCENKDGGVAPRIPLNDGNAIPALGYGSFLGFDENGQKEVKEGEVEIPVAWALKAGYRLIDTASAYHNEEQIGQAVEKSGIPREDIFVVTKLGSTEQRDVVGALNNSLRRLNMTYVDLYLIHNPVAFKADHTFDVIDYLDTWRGMERVKKLGLARSIGISNFNTTQMDRLLANCEIRPAVLQVEVNLNLAQPRLLHYGKHHNIVIMGYTPFGSLFDKSEVPPPPRADDPVLQEMGKKYGKTAAQIALRYLIQRGVVPIPKSVHKDRIEQNINVFDFEMTEEELNTLSKFNKDYRVVWPSFWQDHPYYPFEKKDKPDPDIFKGKE